MVARAAPQPVGVRGGGDLGRLAGEQRLRRPRAGERLDADRLDAVGIGLVGERDTKFRAIAERMGFPTVVIPGAGHAVHLEDPAAVAAHLAVP